MQHGIKVNLSKCKFGSTEVAYLRFRLTKAGILLRTEKLQAMPPPTNIHVVHQFLWLCNFFWYNVCDFAQMSDALSLLSPRKTSPGKEVSQPLDALKAFTKLSGYLSTESIVDYPRKHKPYSLIISSSLDQDPKLRGLSAILPKPTTEATTVSLPRPSRSSKKHKKLHPISCGTTICDMLDGTLLLLLKGLTFHGIH
jgi:hypothetical protein